MKVQVFVRLKEGVLDVQGKTVQNGLTHLGFEGIENVRIGKLIEFEIDATTSEDAQSKTKEICEQLLANPVIEDYEIRSV